MKLITTTPDTLTEASVGAINRVVARAFEHTDNEAAMLEDTRAHLAAADTVQIAIDEDMPVALAMYRSCLWRSSC